MTSRTDCYGLLAADDSLDAPIGVERRGSPGLGSTAAASGSTTARSGCGPAKVRMASIESHNVCTTYSTSSP